MSSANNGFDPEEFAKLMASFDTGNSSEAEAMNAGRLLRRSLVKNGLRLVDVMGRADVMQALDARLQPEREESPQLKEAFGKITQLADELAQEREITAELREEIASGAFTGSSAMPVPPRVSDSGSGLLINGGLVAAVSIVAVVLMIAAACQAFQ
jgi:hypothetical protein